MPNLPTSKTPRGSFDAVLFDLYGTLIPTGSEASRTESIEEMARELKVDPRRFSRRWLQSFDQRVRGEFGDAAATVELLARELGGDPTAAAVERALLLRLRYTRSLFDSGRSSLAALDALRAHGARLALVSDASEDTVRVWTSSELATRFEVAVFSCLEGLRKPDPRMFHRALDRLGLPPSACAFVGDGGSRELSGAVAAGLSAFQYLFPEEAARAYRVDAEVDWTGPRLTDLTQLLTADPRRA